MQGSFSCPVSINIPHLKHFGTCSCIRDYTPHPTVVAHVRHMTSHEQWNPGISRGNGRNVGGGGDMICPKCGTQIRGTPPVLCESNTLPYMVTSDSVSTELYMIIVNLFCQRQ